MKVVFLEEVPGSGYPGDVKDVAGGFARNFLLPRKLAIVANKQAMQKAVRLAEAEEKRQAKLDNEASGLAESLDGQTLTFVARVGDQGRLFGSITAGDIAEEATKLAGQEVDRHKIHLGEPIKEVGSRAVKVRLTRNVEVELNIEVQAFQEPGKAPPAAPAATVEESAQEETEAEEPGEAEAVEADAETVEPAEESPETEPEETEPEEQS
jgi:large subunit ribosomal protein L9